MKDHHCLEQMELNYSGYGGRQTLKGGKKKKGKKLQKKILEGAVTVGTKRCPRQGMGEEMVGWALVEAVGYITGHRR